MTRAVPSPRVVSLVPSVTESLLAWGLEPVAVTRFCEHPELRSVGGTKDPDIASIVAMQPDLVVVNTEENRRQDAEDLAAAGVEVLVLDIDTVDDVAPALDALAQACGLDAVAPSLEPAVDPPARVRAFVPIWRRPWMALGPRCYGTSLLARLGVDVVQPEGAADQRYPTVELDAVAAASPDVVLAPSEPYPFAERHVAELAVVAPVHLVDGKDLFWWGWRTPSAIDRLGHLVDRWAA